MEESQGKESVGIHSSHQGRDSFRARVPAPERMQAASRSERFHPYRRQFSDAAAASLGASPRPLPPSYSGFHGGETREVTHGAAKVSWNQYDDGFLDSKLTGSQCAYPELPAPPVEPPCCLSQSPAHFRPLGPVSQFSSKMHSMKGTPSGSQYTVVSSLKEVTSQSLFPKPIYSYSILIFMALKNSQTGSLPVSEIYSFMMEQFPYFKTAPDGWKNSVRHNLSLNKCFEKVENKMGNSSRKGCLWALNPAKVDKMQEELNKWRRKDSVSVRKSMVRPEDLERLLGEKPEKIPPSPAFPNQASLPKRSSAYDSITLSLPHSRLQDSCLASRHPHYPHVSTPSQQRPGYLSPTAPHPPNLFPLYSPCGQQPPSGLPSHMRGMDSPIAGKTPPAYCASLCPEYGFSPGSMQEVILKGDASYDVDSINPSLTDLQLQGNLWEELREDSMAPDSLSHITTFPLSITQIQIQTQGRPDLASVIGLGKGEEEVEEVEDMMGCGFSSEQHINGRYPMVYSGVESLAGYLTSCTTSVSLL